MAKYRAIKESQTSIGLGKKDPLFLQKPRRGFTLIEALVTIAIIGILSAIAIVALSSARSRARDHQRKDDLTKIQAALEDYWDTNQNYPTCGGGTNLENPSPIICLRSSLRTYFNNSIPDDPLAGHHYYYISDSKHYILAVYLEGDQKWLEATDDNTYTDSWHTNLVYPPGRYTPPVIRQ